MEGATQELLQILSSPPPPATQTHYLDPIALLHYNLERLRESSDERYLFLRCLLELLLASCDSTGTGSSHVGISAEEEERLLYHCIAGVRHTTLHQWNYRKQSYNCCLRDFLFAVGMGGSIDQRHFGNNNGVHHASGNSGNFPLHARRSRPLPKPVIMACLSCAASMWKRGWTTIPDNNYGINGDGPHQSLLAETDDGQSYLESTMTTLFPTMIQFKNDDRSKELLFEYLNVRLSDAFNELLERRGVDMPHQYKLQQEATMSATFVKLLVGEFASLGVGGGYEQPPEFHRLCHRVFECGGSDGDNVVDGQWCGLDAAMRTSMTALASLAKHFLDHDGTASTYPKNEELGSCIIEVATDVLSWEFGASGRDPKVGSSSRRNYHSDGVGTELLRPPKKWRDVLINPEFMGAMFRVYMVVRASQSPQRDVKNDGTSSEGRGRMAHPLRQLLLQLSSVTGNAIFDDDREQGAYASFLMDGCLNVLESILDEQRLVQQQGGLIIYLDQLGDEILDLVAMLARLTTNFRIKILSQLSSFHRYLSALRAVGEWLLDSSLIECQRVEGDVEAMEGSDWRNDALAQILQCSDAMAGDYWLASDAGGQEAMDASRALSSILAPLHGRYCTVRSRISCLEEHYLAREGGADLDEIREEISASELDQEMSSAASLGRLNVLASMVTLSDMFQQCMPRLLTLFEGAGIGGDIAPDMAVILEEARILLLFVGHLLTDDCVGETPSIPESIVHACHRSEPCAFSIISFIRALQSVAETQATKVAAYPVDLRLSPLLAKTILWFFRRWAPAYILPTSDEYIETTGGGILGAYSKPETAQPVISFCSTLCLVYFCHWPQEKEVQDESTSLLLALAKKGAFVRGLMVSSSSFEKIAALHIVCGSLRHNASQQELSSAMTTSVGMDLSIDSVVGYHRLPYTERARVLTCIVVACSEMHCQKSNVILTNCLRAVEVLFSTLVQALLNKQVSSDDTSAQESACLSILLLGGVVLASEMSEPERIPHFLSPHLPHLSGLMTHYAEDLTICEGLLRLFRDYAEQYIAMMTREQSIELFTASATLLRHYSERHCINRVIHKRSEVEAEFDEEQKYNDVLCAIQLLIHLGTKDFTIVCNMSTSSSNGVETGQITDVIFFGLQQVLPLMTQGLLQFPSLCQYYFSLAGFMVETYPEKLCGLPFDLFNSLLESLLFGMSHSDPLVAKSSLQGLASLAREHLRTEALAPHLSTKADIFDNCSYRLMKEVIFQPIIWDRLEPAGMAFLPLAAIDFQKFIGLVNVISQQLGCDEKERRLHTAFEELIKPEMLSKVAAAGREGRFVRLQFKNAFNGFVRDVHSFLIMR